MLLAGGRSKYVHYFIASRRLSGNRFLVAAILVGLRVARIFMTVEVNDFRPPASRPCSRRVHRLNRASRRSLPTIGRLFRPRATSPRLAAQRDIGSLNYNVITMSISRRVAQNILDAGGLPSFSGRVMAQLELARFPGKYHHIYG